MRKLLALVAAMIALGIPTSASADDHLTPQEILATLTACAHYPGHTYEVCVAYIGNSLWHSLKYYYEHKKGSDSGEADGRLSYRFYDLAYQPIVSRVARWPAGDNQVRFTVIIPKRPNSSLVTNRVVFIAIESWEVRSASGQLIYSEPTHAHGVTMCRVQGKLFHIWVVVRFAVDNGYNCLQYPH